MTPAHAGAPVASRELSASRDLDAVLSRQLLWRFVNDRIFDLERRLDGKATLGGGAWARCECGRAGCEETLALAASEYASVRGVPTRFVVSPGHEVDALERVVLEGDGFTVVEAYGRAARAATSPRSS